MLYARAHDGSLGFKKRHSLTLHVGAHQRTVGIVVFKERNKRGSDGNHLTGAYVHVVDVLAVTLRDVVAVTHHDTFVDEPVVFVKRLVSHGNDVTVLFVCGKIMHFVGDAVIDLVHAAVRRLDKAVFVDARVRRKRVDKTDVLSFGGLYRAHSRVMRIVNVADLERSALAVKTAGAEGRQLSLMRKLCNRVGFVHELRQLGGAEKLLYRAGHGTDIDKVLGSRRFGVVLNLHTFPDHSFKARNTDTELILQKLSHASYPAVSEVVDVVAVTHVVS